MDERRRRDGGEALRLYGHGDATAVSGGDLSQGRGAGDKGDGYSPYARSGSLGDCSTPQLGRSKGSVGDIWDIQARRVVDVDTCQFVSSRALEYRQRRQDVPDPTQRP